MIVIRVGCSSLALVVVGKHCGVLGEINHKWLMLLLLLIGGKVGRIGAIPSQCRLTRHVGNIEDGPQQASDKKAP